MPKHILILLKIITLITYILLPFLGFYIGVTYQHHKDNINLNINGDTLQNESFCKKMNETIKVGFDAEKDVKCCKNLYAVLETRSYVRCSSNTILNKNKMRINELEQ